MKYAAGELKVVAYKDGREWATDVVKTTGPAAKIKLSADSKVLNADGRDLAFVTISIVDKDGLRVPTANSLVHFRVSGPGTIRAVGNGDPTNHDSFLSDRYKAFHGQCMLIIQSTEGKRGSIHVTAESEALTSGDIMIIAQ